MADHTEQIRDYRRIEAQGREFIRQATERAGVRCEGCDLTASPLFVHKTLKWYLDTFVTGEGSTGADCFILLCRDCGKIHNRCCGREAGDGSPPKSAREMLKSGEIRIGHRPGTDPVP
jgi:hypothetical protein